MKKKIIYLLIFSLFFISKDVKAFDKYTYWDRPVCGTFEVAGFHTDGYIDTVACFNTFVEAHDYMKSNGAEDLGVLSRVGNRTMLLDTNYGIMDFSGTTDTTNCFENKELTGRKYTYFTGASGYGGSDGLQLESEYSHTYNVWTVKVKFADFTGWVDLQRFEIVPITWVRSYSNYEITNDYIRHNYVSKVQQYSSAGGRTIGPKPEMLNPGTYYSYDGHYFYSDLKTLIRDSKAYSHNLAVNKDKPYYNYYMYLSTHTKTNYSSVNINDYIRNNMGYTRGVYGKIADEHTSKLYGMGTYFYYAQEKNGVNALLTLSLSRNETGNGTSNLAINKNNGFGLNAVDSNPYHAANWYATFSQSILGFTSGWVTYGYAHPRDTRYFGPQFGNKQIGMNVKYASDVYWSEKMASNYYSMDKALGLQDYNYYQLAIANWPANTYSQPSTSSKFIYQYPEANDAMVIVNEVKVNNELWYEVVSDLNIDNNFNEIPAYGDYNWHRTVFIRASDVTKINTAKSGYKSPNSIYEYPDKNYNYDLYITNGELTPKVAVTKKDTPYYYDSTLISNTGKTLLSGKYVMVYSVAYSNGIPVSYLVTSDYWADQKEWVSADSIEFTNISYGKVSVNFDGNYYTWVNSTTIDDQSTLISGLYTYVFVPVLEQVTVGSNVWLKVPISLTSNQYEYGYTLREAPNIEIKLSAPVVENNIPTIQAVDKTIFEGQNFDPKEIVTATDVEDGNLTSKIEVTSNNVDTTKTGTYQVTYKVKDNTGHEVTKTITVTVKENKAPVINAEDKQLTLGHTFDPKKDISAMDEEDGVITNSIVVKTNTVNTNAVGTYKVIYEVKDSLNKTTTKEIKVEVVKDQEPVINVSNQTINLNSIFNPKNNISVTDKEDGDITKNLVVKSNTVDTKKVGTYKVTYEVTDSFGNRVSKEITVTVVEKEYNKKDGEFYLEELSWNNTSKSFTISGYLIIYKVNNTNKKYELLLKSENETHKIDITSWTENIPYELGVQEGYNYNESWFKGKIDLSNIPVGDYNLYMRAYTNDSYTEQYVDNFFNQDIDRRGETSTKGFSFKVLTGYKNQRMELKVRNELYTTSESPTFRNMINDYEEITFKDNKLHMLGYSYNYKGTYSTKTDITRKLIIENTTTFEQKVIDLGSTEGPYTINSTDKLSKTYAWYEKDIEISTLNNGTYSLQVYTKTKDAEDYDEILDIFGLLNETKTINGKTYNIYCNKDKLNRIELTVK